MQQEHSLTRNLITLTISTILLSGCTVPHRIKTRFVHDEGCESGACPPPHASVADAVPRVTDVPVLEVPSGATLPPKRPSPHSKPRMTVPEVPATPEAERPKPKQAEEAATPLIVTPETTVVATDILYWHRGYGRDRLDAAIGQEVSAASLRRRDDAYIDRRGKMQLANGSFVVKGLNERLLAAAKDRNELTIELVLTTHDLRQKGPTRIVSFSADANSRNFTVGQERNQLILRLRTSKNDANGTSPELKLAGLRKDRPTHILISYRDGETLCFMNGRQMLASDKLQGDFSNWEPHHLVFGDEWNRERNWSGDLQLVRISTDFCDEFEATKRMEDWRSRK